MTRKILAKGDTSGFIVVCGFAISIHVLLTEGELIYRGGCPLIVISIHALRGEGDSKSA